MSSAASTVVTSTIIPLVKHHDNHDHIMTLNSDDNVTYEQPITYQKSNDIIYNYSKPKYQYAIEQEGKSYRCCQWCRYWCTRKLPICDFCDRIISCPLLCLILSALLLTLLFIAVLTLFGLHPNINSSQRYYGIISTLSIFNRTKYIYNLDKICSRTSIINNCLDIVTSTSISSYSTTIILNNSIRLINFSHILFILCLLIYFMQYNK